MTVSDKQEQEILLKLYQKSILKKAKHDAISRYLPDPQGKVCLDVGADNGVLSYLFRQRGGNWHSADLDGTIVESIRKYGGRQCIPFCGRTTEFAEETFDTVVIIDFLEHIDKGTQPYHESGWMLDRQRSSS